MNLSGIGEGFEHEQIDAAFEERFRLLAKDVPRFFRGGLAVGLDANAERSNRAGYERALSGGFACYARACVVDLVSVVLESGAAKLDSVGAVGICFDDSGARLDLVALNGEHQLAARKVQLIVTTVDVYASLVEHRAHRAVEHVHTIISHCVAKILHRLLVQSTAFRRYF